MVKKIIKWFVKLEDKKILHQNIFFCIWGQNISFFGVQYYFYCFDKKKILFLLLLIFLLLLCIVPIFVTPTLNVSRKFSMCIIFSIGYIKIYNLRTIEWLSPLVQVVEWSHMVYHHPPHLRLRTPRIQKLEELQGHCVQRVYYGSICVIWLDDF